MKKLILAVALSSVATLSLADGRHVEDRRYYGNRDNHHYHQTGGGGWVAPLIIGGSIGYILGRPQQQVIIQQPVPAPVVVPPQTVYVYPTTAPIMQSPGMYCELRSEMINGQVVTGNFCYQR